jgi:hypothetical protein
VTRSIAAITTFAVLALPAAASAGGIFGTYPLNISVAPSGAPADGSSSAPTVSGDNRKTRLAAFQSDATNLVGGDANGATDVFVWVRPKGHQGLSLPKGSGTLQRASVTDSGAEANGASRNPSLDGSVTTLPHCVAFESDASNMAPGDADATTDVFVRDLRANKTYLVSRGVTAAATDPSIAGDCSRVAFVANGLVVDAPVKGGKIKSLGGGKNPDYSLDGRAVAWEQGSNVAFVRDGKKAVVGPGFDPTVTDAERLHHMTVPRWGVSFSSPAKLASRDSNPGIDTYLRVYGPKGSKPQRTDLISYAQPKVKFDGRGDNYNGGITAYGTTRGIITFVHTQGSVTDAYYWNQNTGNADDTAHAAANGSPGINQHVTSARANFVAFSSSYTGDMAFPYGSRKNSFVGSIDSLFTNTQSVYLKMLVDGEAI